MSRLLLVAVFSCLGAWTVQSQTAARTASPSVARPTFARPTAATSSGGVAGGRGALGGSVTSGGGVAGANVAGSSGVLRESAAGSSTILRNVGETTGGVVLGGATVTDQSGLSRADRAVALSQGFVDGQEGAGVSRNSSVASELGARGIVAPLQSGQEVAQTAAIETIADPIERERARIEAQRAFQEELREAIFEGGTTRVTLPQSENIITVISTNGTVTVTGAVRDSITRSEVESEIRALAELTAINNQLVAETDATTSQLPRTTAAIREASGAAVFSQSLSEAVSAGGTTRVFSSADNSVITVVSGNGIVALFGEVPTFTRSASIAEQVSQIAGVREVQNNLVVRGQ